MRLLGITIPEEKRIDIGLTTLFGIGRSRARVILVSAKVDQAKKPKDISIEEENRIRARSGSYPGPAALGDHSRLMIACGNHAQ